jgi:hypothetical protein
MSQPITIRHAEKLGSLLLILMSIGVFALSGQLVSGRPPEADPGPAFFPRLILAGIAILSVVQLLLSIRRGTEVRYEVPRSTAKTVATVSALLLLFVASLSTLGFLIASALFLIVLLRYSGETDYRIIALISVGLPLVLFVVFAGIFDVRLPENPVMPLSRVIPILLELPAAPTGVK